MEGGGSNQDLSGDGRTVSKILFLQMFLLKESNKKPLSFLPFRGTTNGQTLCVVRFFWLYLILTNVGKIIFSTSELT